MIDEKITNAEEKLGDIVIPEAPEEVIPEAELIELDPEGSELSTVVDAAYTEDQIQVSSQGMKPRRLFPVSQKLKK